jgi:preprotein translocase subunit YajC
MLTTILLMAGGKGGNPLTTFLPFLLIIVVFYFFMIRPQTKKAKAQQQFKDTINKGDNIVTIGGLRGKIVEIKPSTFMIETGNVKLEIEKSAVSMEQTNAINKNTEK